MQRELANELRRERLVGGELLLHLGVGRTDLGIELEDRLDTTAPGEALREVDVLLQALDEGVAKVGQETTPD